jgi:hypothetical protein
MDIFLNILIGTLCVCTDRFQGLSEGFQYPLQFLPFYCFFENYLLIFKMLIETLLKILFSVIGRCSLVPFSLWAAGKMRKN